MAKIPWYAIGNSGTLGKKIFCTRKGTTYLRKRAGSYNVVATPAQLPLRNRFTDAHRFAQSVIADQQLKAEYTIRAADKRSAYSQAMSEYLRER